MSNSKNIKAFTDFRDGMNSVGNFWNRIEPFPTLQAKLLGYSLDALTAELFENLLEYRFSETGSNDFILEQETAFSMSMFLQKLEGKVYFTSKFMVFLNRFKKFNIIKTLL